LQGVEKALAQCEAGGVGDVIPASADALVAGEIIAERNPDFITVNFAPGFAPLAHAKLGKVTSPSISARISVNSRQCARGSDSRNSPAPPMMKISRVPRQAAMAASREETTSQPGAL
jgi:hypothetical protein